MTHASREIPLDETHKKCTAHLVQTIFDDEEFERILPTNCKLAAKSLAHGDSNLLAYRFCGQPTARYVADRAKPDRLSALRLSPTNRNLSLTTR